MSVARRVLKNTGALAAGRIVTKAMSLAFLGYVTRHLGEAGFGRFATAMALVGFVEVLPGYVSRAYIVRTVARMGRASSTFLGHVVATNVLLSLALFGVLFLVVPLLGYAGDTRLATYILAASLLFSSITNTYHAAFAGHERMELSALVDVANTLLTIALGVAVLAQGGEVVPLASVYLAARAVTWAIARRMTRRLSDAAPFTLPGWLETRTLASAAWPFFITSLFIIFYNRADIIMLSLIPGPIDAEIAVGRYNAAYKLMEALGLVTSAFVAAIYPVLARQWTEGGDRVRVTFRAAMRALCAFALPVAVGTTLLAPDVMGLLFGAPFFVAGAALQVLIWGQVLDSVNPLAGTTLRAADRERDLALITGVCAVFNVVLNLFLIPRYSYMGAAWATLASFALVFAWNMRVLRGVIGKLDIAGDIARAAAAAFVMGVAVYFARRYGLGVAITAGVVSYVPLAFAFGLVDTRVIAAIRRRILKSTA
ncbi:flippase [bacterium]|nr:flippase [bacterium]